MENAYPSDRQELVQQLFVKHAFAIRACIRGLVPDFDAADDILQECFLTVNAKADTFQEGSDFLAWAATIARFKVLEWQRRNPAGERIFSPEVIDMLWAATPPYMDADNTITMMLECVDELSASLRELIELRYSQGCKPGEIAARLNWTPEAVYVGLSRARAILRKCIERKQELELHR